MPAIRIENLTKKFGSNIAVNGLSLSVDAGEIFGLVGPDGAGKSTIMRLLTAIMDPTSGDAWVGGHHVVKDGEALKEKIGYMSQQFGLYEDLTVMENINFYADIYSVPRKSRDEKIARLLAFSNLTPFKKRLAGNLSGGMKQKLGLVCALIHTPEILFLDEPTNGVDPVSRRDFWSILDQLLRQNVTIFLSTAYLDEAERCHRIGLIHNGELLTSGTPREVKKLMQGAIIQVRTPSPRDAFHILVDKRGKESVSLFGDRVHVISDQPEKTLEEIKSALGRAGIQVSGLRSMEPSLEDVFISMLGEDNTVGAHDEG
jgi:drug efflux transport system ATP-binding protein